jgi:hypothetical protein
MKTCCGSSIPDLIQAKPDAQLVPLRILTYLSQPPKLRSHLMVAMLHFKVARQKTPIFIVLLPIFHPPEVYQQESKANGNLYRLSIQAPLGRTTMTLSAWGIVKMRRNLKTGLEARKSRWKMQNGLNRQQLRPRFPHRPGNQNQRRSEVRRTSWQKKP